MANIQEDINQIATARYGREVRGSIVNALTLMNEESSEAIDKAVTAQDSATASAAEAKGYADRLVDFGGGTTGQVLTKKSNADFDYSWEESQGGTSDAYETTYGESNVGDTLDIMPRLAGAVQGASPTPKDADTLGGKYRAEDIDLIKKNLESLVKTETISIGSVSLGALKIKTQTIDNKFYTKKILGCTVVGLNSNVFMVSVAKRTSANAVYLIILNTYEATVSDTLSVDIHYID